MARVAAESGTSFDPQVVRVLERRYRELETRAQELGGAAITSLSTDICITRGAAPAAGFASDPDDHHTGPSHSDAAATALIALRLQGIVSHDAIAIYRRQSDVLIPEFVGGSCCSGLANLRIPVGEGLAGWVAQSGRVILNGNPQVEPGYVGALQSALAVPIETNGSVSAVLCLYSRAQDAFRPDQVASVTHFQMQDALSALSKINLVPGPVVEQAIGLHFRPT